MSLGSFSFDSDVLYEQELFGEGSIDYHLFVDNVFGMGELNFTEEEFNFHANDHTIFVFWPPKSNSTRVSELPYTIDAPRNTTPFSLD